MLRNLALLPMLALCCCGDDAVAPTLSLEPLPFALGHALPTGDQEDLFYYRPNATAPETARFDTPITGTLEAWEDIAQYAGSPTDARWSTRFAGLPNVSSVFRLRANDTKTAYRFYLSFEGSAAAFKPYLGQQVRLTYRREEHFAGESWFFELESATDGLLLAIVAGPSWTSPSSPAIGKVEVDLNGEAVASRRDDCDLIVHRAMRVRSLDGEVVVAPAARATLLVDGAAYTVTNHRNKSTRRHNSRCVDGGGDFAAVTVVRNPNKT